MGLEGATGPQEEIGKIVPLKLSFKSFI